MTKQPLVAVLVVALLASACASTSPGAGSASKGKGKGDTAPGAFAQTTSPTEGAEPTGGTPEVWAHSVDTLFKLDPLTKQVSIVGKFTGCTTDVIDIALDADSNIYATTDDNDGEDPGAGGIWRVDRQTGACTLIAHGTYPNSLSFVPRGTVDPDAEALVGFQDNNDYIRIDTKTGKITKVGSLGDVPFSSSGDLVSVKGGPTYLTVTAQENSDGLVEVDPKTGAVIKDWGPIGHVDVYGIAFWAGSVYGFDDEGELFEVTFEGGKLAKKDLPIPGKEPHLQFGGAGSTTIAPVAPITK